MKNNFTLTFLSLILFSCNINDNELNEDPIIGEWAITVTTWIDVSTNMVVYEGLQNSCYQYSIENYSSNGTFSYSSFYENDQGECVNLISNIVNGQWELQSNGLYRVTGDVTHIDGTSFFIDIEFDEILFSNNGNEMTKKDTHINYDSDGNVLTEVQSIFEYDKI